MIIGISGVCAQVLLLRELLVSFFGNELTLGMILANWMVLEAVGALAIGRIIERAKNPYGVFIILEIVFSIGLLCALYCARVFKVFMHLPVGQGLGLMPIFWVSFLIQLPVSFSHGALFSAACKIHSFKVHSAAKGIGSVYTLETVGTALGGLLITYLLVPWFGTFAIAGWIALANFFISLILLRNIVSARVRIATFASIIALSCICIILQGFLQTSSIREQWRGNEVVAYRNSVYGNIVITQRDRQKTFFYNGIPVVAMPYPDIAFVEEFAGFPLLLHGHAKKVLVIGAGSGGLLREILKYPISKLDYAQVDPEMIALLKRYSPDLVRGELSDKRVKVINKDGRSLLLNRYTRYDVVILAIPEPSDLTTNRYFSEEFFLLVKKRLNPLGLLAIKLPGSETYLERSLRDLNACVRNGLAKVFRYTKVVPGESNFYFSSDSPKLTEASPQGLWKKMQMYNVVTNTLTLPYLKYRLDAHWVQWFEQSMQNATTKRNSDFRPVAVLYALIRWNKQFSQNEMELLGRVGSFVAFFSGIAILCALSVFLIIFAGKKARQVPFPVAYGIATTGFFSMLFNLLLIFCFQAFFGYLYRSIGALIALFMAGIAFGSFLASRKKLFGADNLRAFLSIEILILLFSLVMGVALKVSSASPSIAPGVFIGGFFITGVLTGCQFPLASALCAGNGATAAGATAGFVYFFDLLGGWLAGILGGVVLLPLLGVFYCCLAIAVLKTASLFLFVVSKATFVKLKPFS
ncbi:MAG: hypothetical protein AB1530_03360 [Candidatus Omnitrophota bacterium]